MPLAFVIGSILTRAPGQKLLYELEGGRWRVALKPVVNLQAWHTRKFADVVRHQHCTPAPEPSRQSTYSAAQLFFPPFADDGV
jgi:hypothetical protein